MRAATATEAGIPESTASIWVVEAAIHTDAFAAQTSGAMNARTPQSTCPLDAISVQSARAANSVTARAIDTGKSAKAAGTRLCVRACDQYQRQE